MSMGSKNSNTTLPPTQPIQSVGQEVTSHQNQSQSTSSALLRSQKLTTVSLPSSLQTILQDTHIDGQVLPQQQSKNTQIVTDKGVLTVTLPDDLKLPETVTLTLRAGSPPTLLYQPILQNDLSGKTPHGQTPPALQTILTEGLPDTILEKATTKATELAQALSVKLTPSEAKQPLPRGAILSAIELLSPRAQLETNRPQPISAPSPDASTERINRAYHVPSLPKEGQSSTNTFSTPVSSSPASPTPTETSAGPKTAASLFHSVSTQTGAPHSSPASAITPETLRTTLPLSAVPSSQGQTVQTSPLTEKHPSSSFQTPFEHTSPSPHNKAMDISTVKTNAPLPPQEKTSSLPTASTVKNASVPVQSSSTSTFQPTPRSETGATTPAPPLTQKSDAASVQIPTDPLLALREQQGATNGPARPKHPLQAPLHIGIQPHKTHLVQLSSLSTPPSPHAPFTEQNNRPDKGEIPSTILGKTFRGYPVLQAGTQTFILQTQAPLEVGQSVSVKFLAESDFFEESDLPSAHKWSALRDMFTELVETQPTFATNLAARMIPQPTEKLSSTLLLFFAALNGGSFEALIPTEDQARLSDPKKKDLLSKLTDEFRQHALQTQKSDDQEWKLYQLPMLGDDALSYLNFYVHNQRRETDNPASHQDMGQRFVIDIELSELGDIQLDGFIVPDKLELIFRSDKPLSETFTLGLQTIFTTSLEAIGMTGNLMVQQGKEQFVTPLPPSSNTIYA